MDAHRDAGEKRFVRRARARARFCSALSGAVVPAVVLPGSFSSTSTRRMVPGIFLPRMNTDFHGESRGNSCFEPQREAS
jgi:hypothetical protein